MDLVTIRTALLISLSILLVLLVYQRFRRRVLAREVPAPLHAELLRLQVAYHPARLLAEVRLPEAQRIITGLSDSGHSLIHQWPDAEEAAGVRELERLLPDLPEGIYHFELRTATQRTVRRFRLQP